MAVNDSKIIAVLDKIAKEQNLQSHSIDLKPISSGGANFTSVLYVAIITSNNKDDLHLFIKVAAMGEKVRDSISFKIYDIEKFIYSDFKTVIRKIEDKFNVAEDDRLRLAAYYGASTAYLDEMIVLENLLSRGFACHDRMLSVDWEYAATAITEAAKLHAVSVAMKHYYPDDFAIACDMLNSNLEMFTESIKDFWDGSAKSALDVVNETNRDKLVKFLENHDHTILFDNNKLEKTPMFIHGDFRPSNLLHRHRDDGKLEVIPVDYQTIRAGCPVVDLLYFIFTGTDAEFRRNYYGKLIDFYYTELRAAMTRFGLNPDEIYSRQDFDTELKERLPFGLAIALFALPIVTVETENAPKVDKNLGLADFAIQKTSSMYPERLNGVVDDYVRWGLI